MVAATSEALERVSAERRARWLRSDAGGGVCWLGRSSACPRSARAALLWPRGGTPLSVRLRGAGRRRRRGHARPAAPRPAVARCAGLLAALPTADGVTHGNPAQRMVALTFDDGPSGRTPAILRVLAHHHAHATFFVVGRATRGMEPCSGT